MGATTEGRLAPTQQDRVFVFASGTKEAPDWREWLKKDGAHSEVIQPMKTDLEKLFTALLALPPAPRSLFLFTDGWETQGMWRLCYPQLRPPAQDFPGYSNGAAQDQQRKCQEISDPQSGKSGEALISSDP
jgi:hypothetical protein